MNAKFYFNNIFIGDITNLIVQISEKGFETHGPKAVVQFFGNKEVVEQWFIVHTLNYSKGVHNKILLSTDDYYYKILSLNSIIVIPIVDSNDWKFKIRVFGEEEFNYNKKCK